MVNKETVKAKVESYTEADFYRIQLEVISS